MLAHGPPSPQGRVKMLFFSFPSGEGGHREAMDG